MTTDERLDRLIERHEALTQSVELITSMQRDNEERMTKLIDAVASLVRIVQDHERRIEGLEQR